MRHVFAPLAIVLLLSACGGGKHATFTNPVIDVDFPDPFVLKAGDTYYAYATEAGPAQVPTFTSKDLVHWKRAGDALPHVGTWTFDGQTWGPSVLKRSDGTYVLYYTANLCIGRATARMPLGPFHDPFAKALICQTGAGGSIDPSPFRDASGALYLVWKNDGNNAGQPTHIWSQRLSADGLQLVGAPKILITGDQPWEGSIVEGPALWEHDGRYYLFFSGGSYATSGYSVGYATCKGPSGPCTQAAENPILKSGCGAYGPGGETLLDVGGTTWMLYHAWPTVSGGSKRELWLDRVDWKDGKPAVHGPTCTAQSAP